MNKDLQFILELEKMKEVFRMTRLLTDDRRENDAEHSWSIATMTMFLDKYSKVEIDTSKIIKMLLIHDTVEIYAGDTFAYDEKANENKLERELEAMKKLKSYLDEEKGEMLNSLWLEFEEKKTNDAKFANAMDRLQPLLLNIESPYGGTWKKNEVRLSQVLKRAEPIKILDGGIYEYVYKKIMEHVEKDNIIRD